MNEQKLRSKSRIFFTSDTHFFHKKILDYENRPFKDVYEMNEILIKNWNETISDKDKIYILGDFSFGNKLQTLNILNRLNGQKYLITGNHDSVITENKEIRDKFVWIKDYAPIKYNKKSIILFHYPIQVFDKQHYGSVHVYGHVHSDKENHHPMLCKIKNAYNVGVDVNDFRPISLEEVYIKLGIEE